MPIYDPGDVVTVPFPFTDSRQERRRPAVVMSARRLSRRARQYVLAMVTSAQHERWPFDVPVSDQVSAGLPAPSVVRWKLFSLDASLVLRRIGSLCAEDRRALRRRLGEALLPAERAR